MNTILYEAQFTAANILMALVSTDFLHDLVNVFCEVFLKI